MQIHFDRASSLELQTSNLGDRYKVKEDSTDELLLTAARQGNQQAFLLLFKRYRTRIFRFVYRLTGSEKAAENITHDCFLSLVGTQEDSEPKGISILIDLYSRARRLGIEYEQDRVNDKLQVGGVEEEPVETVKKSINDLPLTERETLILFEYERLSIREIATIVEVNDEVVRTRLRRARQKLRAVLSRQSQEAAKQSNAMDQ